MTSFSTPTVKIIDGGRHIEVKVKVNFTPEDLAFDCTGYRKVYAIIGNLHVTSVFDSPEGTVTDQLRADLTGYNFTSSSTAVFSAVFDNRNYRFNPKKLRKVTARYDGKLLFEVDCVSVTASATF